MKNLLKDRRRKLRRSTKEKEAARQNKEAEATARREARLKEEKTKKKELAQKKRKKEKEERRAAEETDAKAAEEKETQEAAEAAHNAEKERKRKFFLQVCHHDVIHLNGRISGDNLLPPSWSGCRRYTLAASVQGSYPGFQTTMASHCANFQQYGPAHCTGHSVKKKRPFMQEERLGQGAKQTGPKETKDQEENGLRVVLPKRT